MASRHGIQREPVFPSLKSSTSSPTPEPQSKLLAVADVVRHHHARRAVVAVEPEVLAHLVVLAELADAAVLLPALQRAPRPRLRRLGAGPRLGLLGLGEHGGAGRSRPPALRGRSVVELREVDYVHVFVERSHDVVRPDVGEARAGGVPLQS